MKRSVIRATTLAVWHAVVDPVHSGRQVSLDLGRPGLARTVGVLRLDWGPGRVRSLLTTLGFHPQDRHLAELGPPPKTLTVQRGRPLKLTPQLIARGCSHLAKPFGDVKIMMRHLEQDKWAPLKRHLFKAIQSLYGLYQYAKLQGAVRIRHGRIDRMLPVPWVHDAEHTLRDLKRKAYEHDLDIEAHLGESAVSLDAPWSNTHRLRVERYDRSRYLLQLRDWGAWVNDDDVFLARSRKR